MDYYGIGFSNIRLPNDSKSYIYKYDSRINAFPEEVLLHEFLHSLERNAQEYGLTRVFSNSRDFIEQIEYLKSKKDELKISDLIKETLIKLDIQRHWRMKTVSKQKLE